VDLHAVYAPAVQKEREVIEEADAQLLWLIGEESHSGSHSPYYGIWSSSGGGSIMGTGVHPLTAVPTFKDAGHLRTDYRDVEDWGGVHVEFDDGSIADIYACEIVMGGVHNWLEVNANNHRSRVNINPNNALQTYNPDGRQLRSANQS
jgi:predicted dehydrogenase